MNTTNDLKLERMARITRGYGRMLNRSTGLCSLWTEAWLMPRLRMAEAIDA